jgi:hypothetical protein
VPLSGAGAKHSQGRDLNEVKKQSIFRTALAWALFCLGDLVSRPMQRWDLGFLYPIYNRLMGWSADLDKVGKIWDHVEENKGA